MREFPYNIPDVLRTSAKTEFLRFRRASHRYVRKLSVSVNNNNIFHPFSVSRQGKEEEKTEKECISYAVGVPSPSRVLLLTRRIGIADVPDLLESDPGLLTRFCDDEHGQLVVPAYKSIHDADSVCDEWAQHKKEYLGGENGKNVRDRHICSNGEEEHFRVLYLVSIPCDLEHLVRTCTASGIGVLSFCDPRTRPRWYPALDADDERDRRIARDELERRWEIRSTNK